MAEGVERVGDVVMRVVPVVEFEDAVCSCGRVFLRAKGDGVEDCAACRVAREAAERMDGEVRRLRENVGRWVPEWCVRCGMTRREVLAEWEKVPQALGRILTDPRLGVTSMLLGEVPERGFGLVGDTGTGKTFALAAVVKRMAAALWLGEGMTRGMAVTEKWLAWVRWPEVVNGIRVEAATREDGMARAERMVNRFAEARVLVLDDLGAERVRGDYAEDWATSMLDLLIDRRYNAMRPTWWTSNLTVEEFVARYGTRTWSRLAGDNPAVRVVRGGDLRMVPR